MECLDKCRLNINDINIKKLVNRKNDNTTIKTLKAQSKGINYRLEYAPVGYAILEANGYYLWHNAG